MRKLVLGSLLLVSGVALADPSYNLKIDAPSAKKAQKAVVKIQITPGAGFHVNKDYPAKLKVEAPAGVKVDPTQQTITEQAAEFDLPFTADATGKQTFTGELKFAVCSASSCDPKKEKLTFTVDVK